MTISRLIFISLVSLGMWAVIILAAQVFALTHRPGFDGPVQRKNRAEDADISSKRLNLVQKGTQSREGSGINAKHLRAGSGYGAHRSRVKTASMHAKVEAEISNAA